MIQVSEKVKLNILLVFLIFLLPLVIQNLFLEIKPQWFDATYSNYKEHLILFYIIFYICNVIFITCGLVIRKPVILYFLPVINLFFAIIFYYSLVMDYGTGKVFSIILDKLFYKLFLMFSISLVPSLLIFLIIYFYNRFKATKVPDDITDHLS